MQKGDVIQGTVQDLDHEGRGWWEEGGLRLLVAGGAPGDVLRVEVEHLSPHKPVAWGRVVEVISRGPHFVEPPCPHAWPTRGQCGGCPLMHLGAQAQAEVKRKLLPPALDPSTAQENQGAWGTLSPTTNLLHPEGASFMGASSVGASFVGASFVGASFAGASFARASFVGAHAPPHPRDFFHEAPTKLGYRARAHFVAGRGPQGVALGSFAPGSHELARMDGCLVVRPDVERIARTVEGHARALDVPTWPTPDGLRYATVRASEGGECLVELIAGSLDAPWLRALAQALSQVAGLVGVSASPNASLGNAMRVAAPTVLWGRASILDDVGPLRLEMRADTFSQLHLGVAAQMYARAAQWAWEDADQDAAQGAQSVVWDLYCGLGGLGLRVALERPGAQVWGAESVEGSLDLARRNADAAKIEARYEVLDLRTRAPSSWPAPEIVLVNPPRRGLDAPILAALARSPARAILYMSCGPESFARDVAELGRAGWRLDQAEAHDMLPQTAHVELLGVLRR